MASSRITAIFIVMIAFSAGYCGARPIPSDGGQPAWQMSALNRAASSLKLQLSSVQLQLQAFANALIYNPPASTAPIHQHLRPVATPAPQPPAATFSASSSAGSSDDLSARGYTIHAPDSMAAIGLTAAERYATARAAVADRLRAHTFHPASSKGERTTVLMKASGEVFTRKWTWDGPPAGVDLFAAAAALQPRPTAAANAGSAATEASGAVGCDGCIGPDSRAQVTSAASATFPHTAIGMLTATAPPTPGSAASTQEWCTGAMISPRHVLTAAHCVFDVEGAHGAMTNLKFAPGRDGAATPFGIMDYETVRLLGQFQTQPSYTDTAANNDFAVVTLAQPVGRQTGWLGLEFSQAAEVDVDLTTAGFPDDKPAETMWQSACANTAFYYGGDTTNHVVQHTCDSTHGQSGSPMWDSSLNVRAVLTGGNQGGLDWALKVDDFVFATILGWMQEDGEFVGVGVGAAGAAHPVMQLADVSGAAAAAAPSGM